MRAYWYPLYAYVRRRVTDVNDAHDLTQAFFAELLAKNYVGSANAERGRFRAFLLTCVEAFPVEGMGQGQDPKAGRGQDSDSTRLRVGYSQYRLEPAAV